MVATKFIAENELIFTERASSFVPVNDVPICQQCAAHMIIPFPCSHCYNQVVYCSRRCAEAHSNIHVHECQGYQRKLFSHIGISHLAFRIMLDALPQVAPLLGEQLNGEKMWTTLTGNGSVAQSNTLEYGLTLRMVTHLGRMPLSDITAFACIAHLLLVYLKECTGFFDFIPVEAKASRSDWELLIASIILRHIGQLIANGHSCVVIAPLGLKSSDPMTSFGLLASELWCRPLRVRRGRLHTFSHYGEIAAVNFPYLSLCNHSCKQPFHVKFSGRYMKTYAAHPTNSGEEICYCYTADYRNSKCSRRQADLKSIFHFECSCVKCNRAHPDEEYEAFNRYRCESLACGKVFVPQLPQLCHLNWWDADGLPENQFIKCSICGVEQRCQWFNKYENLMHCTRNVKARQLLYKQFDALDNWLVGYNNMKISLAMQIVTSCFKAHVGGSFLADDEFQKLVQILSFHMRGVAAQNAENSLPYVIAMTYLWDFIAMEKHKCTKAEAHAMLIAIRCASDEIKAIFMNYYDDYIEPVLI